MHSNIGVYVIENLFDGKKYVGQSKNLRNRLAAQKYNLTRSIFNKTVVNKYLYDDVQFYGWEGFKFYVVQSFDHYDREILLSSEAHWIDRLNTTDRRFGYNLRVDDSDGYHAHPETVKLLSSLFSGQDNPNYGNSWTDEMKQRASEKLKVVRNTSPAYKTQSFIESHREASRERWSDPNNVSEMAKTVHKNRCKYMFEQYARDGTFIRVWESVDHICSENSGYKWQNIYSVCSGYKPTYRGYIWKKIPMPDDYEMQHEFTFSTRKA